MSDWMPIESAPKGERVVLRDESFTYWVGRAADFDPEEEKRLYGPAARLIPTHWMPLPEPPKV